MLRHLASALALVLLIAGCGGGGDDAAPDTAPDALIGPKTDTETETDTDTETDTETPRAGIPLRAVIEGFYGPPWSHQARLDVVAFAGEMGMNAYFMGAKHDPANVLLWDWPLDARRLAEVDELVAAGREHGVRLCVAISPGHSVEFSSEAHRAAATARFVQLHDHGVDCFVLAFDDTPKDLRGADPQIYGGYAEGQAAFSHDVLERTRAVAGADALYVFVPNDYWTEVALESDDLATVAAALPAWVDIAWTGPQVCSPRVTAEDARAFAAIIGRPPVLGENDLVKDGDTRSGSLALAPFAARSPALAAELRGFGVNLTPLPYAGLAPLATAAAWALDPASYDPAVAFETAARALAGDDAAVLLALAPWSALPCADGERLPLPGGAAFEVCRVALVDGREDVRAACEPVRDDVLPALAHAPDDLAAAALPGLLGQELRPWATQLATCATLARTALALGIAPALGAPPTEEAVAAAETAWVSECLESAVRLRLAELDALVREALRFARAGL